VNSVRLMAATLLCALGTACGTEPNPPDNGGGTPPPGPVIPPPGQTTTCTQPTEITLAAGGHTIIDPATNLGCIRIPEAGTAGAEHVVVAMATNGRETSSGVSVTYDLRGTPTLLGQVAATADAPLPRELDPRIGKFAGRLKRDEFHKLLRAKERVLSKYPVPSFNRSPTGFSGAAVPPQVGDQRTFKVCSTEQCTSFVDVTATVRHVGPKGAIYLDDTVPAGGYTQTDINAVGALFDTYLYPIDTTSFGRESDLDNNGVVVVLLTDQVNTLSGNCNSAGSVILGYFFGNDLLPGQTGSNGGEVFYGLVPNPGSSTCTISRDFASDLLAPTFIHEFQHMISFNQHVLVRGGFSEDTWLNEGLSHFAEELAGRQIPDALCHNQDCFTQFASGDAGNAYRYLSEVEDHFLVEPGSSGGTLEERGANWLFVRWLVDHFGADVTGAAFTRSLVATNRLGAENVAAATGVQFSTLTPQWQLANYLDNLPGYVPGDGRLQYSSWNFRATFASFNQQAPGSFPRPYPLVPDSTRTGVYSRQGTLRAGSGPHVRIIQTPNANPVTVQLTDGARNPIGSSTAAPRIAIARIR